MHATQLPNAVADQKRQKSLIMHSPYLYSKRRSGEFASQIRLEHVIVKWALAYCRNCKDDVAYVSQVSEGLTNQEVYLTKLNGPGADHSHYPALRCGSFALSILRWLKSIRKCAVPYPLLGGRDTSGLFRSLLWRLFGFQGVTVIAMEGSTGSPAPTRFSRVSEAGSSPGQWVMFAQNVPSVTSYNQQLQASALTSCCDS